MFKYFLSIVICSILLSCGNAEPTSTTDSEPDEKTAATQTLYVGTYTKKEGHVDGKAQGIYVLEMNIETGELTATDTILNSINPSYVVAHPNKKYLYAVNEIADGKQSGTVTAYRLADGKITELNKVSSKGDAPCYISIDASGKFVLVANYMENIATYRIEADGSLSEAISVMTHKRTAPETFRQETGHPHMIAAIDAQTVLVTDLGLDELLQYHLDEKGVLTKMATTPTAAQSGPRHFEQHPSQPWIYVLCELNNTVQGFEYLAADRPMKPITAVATLPKTDKNAGAAAIHIHPNGRFLYTSNRGINGGTENSLSIFSIDEVDGHLTLLKIESSKGLVPRDFTISDNGRFLLVANQNSDSIFTFKINEKTGFLEDTGFKINVLTPVCFN